VTCLCTALPSLSLNAPNLGGRKAVLPPHHRAAGILPAWLAGELLYLTAGGVAPPGAWFILDLNVQANASTDRILPTATTPAACRATFFHHSATLLHRAALPASPSHGKTSYSGMRIHCTTALFLGTAPYHSPPVLRLYWQHK